MVKRFVGLLLLCVLVSACHMKPLTTDVYENRFVVNNDEFIIQKDFVKSAIVETRTDYGIEKTYIYRNEKLKSWLLIVLGYADCRNTFWGEGETLRFMNRKYCLYGYELDWFTDTKFHVVWDRTGHFDPNALKDIPVDIVYYTKVLNPKKGIHVVIISEEDKSLKNRRQSHIDEAELCFRYVEQEED